MGLTTYTCMDCETLKTVDDQGSYPRLCCDTCGGDRPFIHPTDVHNPDPELAEEFDFNPASAF